MLYISTQLYPSMLRDGETCYLTARALSVKEARDVVEESEDFVSSCSPYHDAIAAWLALEIDDKRRRFKLVPGDRLLVCSPNAGASSPSLTLRFVLYEVDEPEPEGDLL